MLQGNVSGRCLEGSHVGLPAVAGSVLHNVFQLQGSEPTWTKSWLYKHVLLLETVAWEEGTIRLYVQLLNCEHFIFQTLWDIKSLRIKYNFREDILWKHLSRTNNSQHENEHFFYYFNIIFFAISPPPPPQPPTPGPCSGLRDVLYSSHALPPAVDFL